MSKELFIASSPHETKVAVSEDDELVEVYHERDTGWALVGSIYKGRVTRVLPGMQSAFVDIGLERDAFLYVSDFFEDSEEYEKVVSEAEARVGRAATAELQTPPTPVAQPEPVTHEHVTPEQVRGITEQSQPSGTDTAADENVTQAVSSPAEAPSGTAAPEAEPSERATSARISEPATHPAGAEAVQPSESAPPQQSSPTQKIAPPFRGGESQDRRPEHRGRRRRRRGHGGFGDRRFTSRPEPQERPSTPAYGAHEFEVLPGESLAKYSQPGSEPQQEPNGPAASQAFPDAPEAVAPYETGSAGAGTEPLSATIPQKADAPGAPDAPESGPPPIREPEAAPVPVREPEPEPEEEQDSAGDDRLSDLERQAVLGVTLESQESAEAEEGDRISSEAAAEFSESALGTAPSAPVEPTPAASLGSHDQAGANPEIEDLKSEPLPLRTSRRESEIDSSETRLFITESFREELDSPLALTEDANFDAGAESHETDAETHEAGTLEPGPGMQGESDLPQEAEDDHESAVEDSTATSAPVPSPGAPDQSYTLRGPQQRRPRFAPRRGRRGRRSMGPRRPSVEPTRLAGNNQPVQISELLKEGQEILVQIAKEPLGTKGARITSHVALPGRYLVYMPTIHHIGVSRKIASEEERLRLRNIILENRGPLTGGFIVRTAGQGRSEEEFKADLRFLTTLWNEIRAKFERGRAPALLHRDLDLTQRILRDILSPDFKRVRVDNEVEYERIVDFVSRCQPALLGQVKLYAGDNPMFEQFGIQEEIDKALKPKVWLKSGGFIVINQTEALVAIDVNTGKYVGKTNRLEDTIVKTNIDAVREIVRQIRLRDLGGIIVIDFIDMDERRNRQKVVQALDEALRRDRAPTNILSINEFGLVALTRKRVKQSLERTLCEPCNYCGGSGWIKSVNTVCYEILSEARKMAKQIEGEVINLRVNPEVARALKSREGILLSELESITRKDVVVKSDPTVQQERFEIF